MWRARKIVIASLLLLCPPCTLGSPSSTADGRMPATEVTTAAALSSSDFTTSRGLTATDVFTSGTPPVTPPIQLPPLVTLPSVHVHVPLEWPSTSTSTRATEVETTDGRVTTKDMATTIQPTPPVELPPPDEFHEFTIKPVEFRLVEEIPSTTEESIPEPQTMRTPEINTEPPHENLKGMLILMPPMEHLDMAPPVPFGSDTTSKDDTTNDTISSSDTASTPEHLRLQTINTEPPHVVNKALLPVMPTLERQPPMEHLDMAPPVQFGSDTTSKDDTTNDTISSSDTASTPEPLRLQTMNTEPPHVVNKALLPLMPTLERQPPMEHLDMAPPVPFGSDTTSKDDTTNDTISSSDTASTPEPLRLQTINTEPPHVGNKALLPLMPTVERQPPMEHLDMAPPDPLGSDTTSKDDTTNDTKSVTTSSNVTSGYLSAVMRLHCRAAHRACVGVSETVRVYGQVEFAVPAYRYAGPFVLGVVLFVTLGFTVALVRKSRSGSKLNKASCILLVAVAAADMLTVTSAIFDLVHMYSASAANYGTMPRNSCRVMYVLERLSAVPHTASIWITTVLAVQRYICVAKPFYASRLISVTSSYAISGAAFVSAVLLHVCRFVDARFEPVNITNIEFPNITIQTCDFKYADWITNPVTYEVAFAWTRVIIVQLIPCVLLVTFASMMIRSLYSSSKALKHSKLGAEKKQSNRRLLTIFVVVVSLIVSVVELVTGVLLCIHAVSISIGTYLLDYVDLKIAAIGIDITLYVSYFCVFVIYCLMSRKFRNRMGTLVEMMTCTYRTMRRRYRTVSAGTKARTCGGIKSDRTQTSIEATCSNLSDNGTHLKHSESAATRTTIL